MERLYKDSKTGVEIAVNARGRYEVYDPQRSQKRGLPGEATMQPVFVSIMYIDCVDYLDGVAATAAAV